MPFDKIKFAHYLRILRELKKVNQRTVADYLNVKQTTYSNYEKGISLPNAEMIVLLSEFFGVPLNELLFGKEATVLEEPSPDYHLSRKIEILEVKIKLQEKQIQSLERELNTNRSYIHRLEKDIAQYEKENNK